MTSSKATAAAGWTKILRVLIAAAASALAVTPGGASATTITAAEAQMKCQALQGRQVGGALIGKAVLAASAGTQAQHCKVSAVLHKSLNFEVQLPSDWNQRLLYSGGGGWNGAIGFNSSGPPAQLAEYVRVASDSGHQGSPIDASWALNNPAAQNDFAYLSVHTVLEATQAIVHEYYGEDARRRYFEGCSNGGREALISASRFPRDFDGIIAGAPVYTWTSLFHAFARNVQHQAHTPGGALTVAQAGAIDREVMAQCDKQDGAADGIIANPAACKFDPGALRCGKTSAKECLTEQQLATAIALYSDVRSKSGRRVYAAHWPGGEAQGWPMWITGGVSAAPGAPVSPIGAQQAFSDGFVKYWLMADPNYDVAKFDFDEHAAAVRRVSALLDAGPDLSAFFALGHKIILWHGTADWGVSAQSSVDYFNAAGRASGGDARRDESMEFFLAPSVQHCRGGSGADTFSFVEPLSAWVERGIRPSSTHPQASKLDAGGKVSLTRPLCAYPTLPRYKGKGDPNDAGNFECLKS
jgi:feruloyl esterase